MTVEQTSQLIQLILNAALMVTACGLVLAGLLARHSALYVRLRTLHQDYLDRMVGSAMLQGDRMTQLKSQQKQFRQRYRSAQNSILTIYAALMTLLVSTLLLALRTVTDQSWLISLSMMFFNGGIALFLAGVGLALVDFYQSRQSLLEELRGLSSLRSGDRPRSAPPRLLPAARRRSKAAPALVEQPRTGSG